MKRTFELSEEDICSLIIVPLPLEPDSDPFGRGLDPAQPEGLVETWGDSDVVDSHCFLGQVNDGFRGFGCLCGSVSDVIVNAGSKRGQCEGSGET